MFFAGELLWREREAGLGEITDADRTFLGSPIPNVIYGLNVDLDWRGFDFSASFSGQAGNEVYNNTGPGLNSNSPVWEYTKDASWTGM